MSLSTIVSRKRALVIATALSTSLSLAAPTLAHAADQPSLAIEEVVVTARKREPARNAHCHFGHQGLRA